MKRRSLVHVALFSAALLSRLQADDAVDLVREVGVSRGLVVFLGDAKSIATVCEAAPPKTEWLAHVLLQGDDDVLAARRLLAERRLLGPVMVEKWTEPRLPFVENLVNALVVTGDGAKWRTVPEEELLRVVAPGGALVRQKSGAWQKSVKKRPEGMDVWQHPAHGPDGNRYSADTVASYPVGVRWMGGMPMNFTHWAAVRGWVVSGTRVYAVSSTEWENLDRMQTPLEYLVARDAYNGLPLWRVPCESTNNTAGLNWRNLACLAADEERVYTCVAGRLVALDGASGKTVQDYPVGSTPVRLALSDGTLVTSCWRSPNNGVARGLWALYQNQTQEGEVHAFEAATGKSLWSMPAPAQYLLASASRVFMVCPGPTQDEHVVAADLRTGRELWRKTNAELGVRPGVELLCAGAKILVAASMGDKKMMAIAADSGEARWDLQEYSSAVIVGDNVWVGKQGYDALTGEVRSVLPAALFSKNGGAPCTPQSVVAGKFILDSRGGRFVDCVSSNSAAYSFRGARGGCIQGATPANGMFYSGQNRCRCTRNQVPGFLAFGPCGGDPSAADMAKARPVERGPAFGAVRAGPAAAGDWPCYRHDMQRSARTDSPLAVETNLLWAAAVDATPSDTWANESRDAFYERISPPVVAGGMVFTARINAGEIVAVSSDTGAVRWRFAAGGRVDSAPTIHRGYCLFGSHDGWVYALRAEDGALAWRARAAPLERRIVAFGRVGSVWPVVGAVGAHEDKVFAGAGRSCDADGGLTLCTLKLDTGETVSAAGWAGGYNDVVSVSTNGQPGKAALLDGSWTRLGRWSRTSTSGLSVSVDDASVRSTPGNVACVIVPEVPKAPPFWKITLKQGETASCLVAGEDLLVGGYGQTTNAIPSGKEGFWRMVNMENGVTMFESSLPAAPVYDGMAVAEGRVFASLEDGRVVCLGEKRK